jgi:ribonucleoside-diphosphate reductase alpha chain
VPLRVAPRPRHRRRIDAADRVELTRRADAGRTFHIEDVQDQVELALMRGEHHKVARAYVLYREERARERARSAPKDAPGTAAARTLHVTAPDGTKGAARHLAS